MNFYIDESGNTGDVSLLSNIPSFDEQRIFSLGCVGLKDEDEFEEQVNAIQEAHNINSRELKSSSLYKKKPEFILDVFMLLREQNIPIFLEIVDKKFLISSYIVDSLIIPGHCFELESPETNYIRNTFADYIYHSMPDDIFIGFIDLCKNPTLCNMEMLFNEFTEVLENAGKNDVSKALLHSLNLSYDEFKELESEEGKGCIQLFLPIPDVGKKGKQVWMLPNLTSFTNIYARINQFLDGKLREVKIFHDHQMQFDDILAKAKNDVERLPKEKIGYVSRSANYKFIESANLCFKDSVKSTGVQVADLLAGFSMRYVNERMSGNVISGTIVEAQRTLMCMNNERKGTGLNMVLSSLDAHKINSEL